MRKALALFLIATFFFPALAYSASVGRITTAGQGKVYVGAEQDYISDKDLSSGETFGLEDYGFSNLKNVSSVDKLSRSMAEVGYGITDNIDVYAKLGVADFDQTIKFSGDYSGSTVTITDKVSGDPAFAYGLGIKGVYDLGGNWLVGGDAQYLGHENDYSGTESIDPAVLSDDTFTGNAKFQEWQASLSLGYKAGNFVPYAGVKYSDMRVKFSHNYESDGTTHATTYKADDNFGAFIGLGYNLSDKWAFNVEGRFIDETAVALTAGYKF